MNHWFSKAEFFTSCLEKESFPDTRYPEIAFIGRSNAGKSSLINHLLQKHNLARVSSTPGKTQRINLFKIDDAYLLADLPGYGFAKTPKHLRSSWGEAISSYLEHRSQLKLILLILDLRRDLSQEDIAMIEWICFHQKRLICVFSKSDTLSKTEYPLRTNELYLQIKKSTSNFSFLNYSIKESACRLHLKQIIRKELHGPS